MFEILGYATFAISIAYFGLKFTARKFIENEFSKQLEKHKQKLNAEFNRMTIIHQKEIEIIPELWGKLQKTLKDLEKYTSLLIITIDFDLVDSKNIEDIIDNISFLSDIEKDKMKKLSTGEQSHYYMKKQKQYVKNNSYISLNSFHEYIQKNSIFLTSDIQQLFLEIDKKIYDTILTKEESTDLKEINSNKESKDKALEAYKKLKEDIIPLKTKLNNMIKERLYVNKTE